MLMMKPKWTFLLEDGSGGWMFYDQTEYESETEVRAFADRVYGGEESYCVVRVDRTVVDEVIR